MRSVLFGICCVLYSVVLPAQQRILLRTPLEYGWVENGQRVGIWKYYDSPGILGMEIDYERMQLLYFRPDSSLYVVQDGGRWIKQKLRRPCRPHGSEMPLLEHFARNLHSPFELHRRAKDKNEVIQTVMTFEVGENGLATNPIVSGYTGFGMEKMMTKAFETAPNLWIPGLKSDGTPANCRFGVSITLCPDTCRFVKPETYRMLYENGASALGPPIESWTMTVEPTGIRHSPDNEWVLVDAKLLATTGGDGFLVVPLHNNSPKNKTIQIPYGNIQNGYWLDTSKIAFKYQYRLVNPKQGIYDVARDSVNTQLDSITYFDRISPDLTKLCVVDYKDKTSNVYLIDIATQQRTLLPFNAATNPIPLSWSPDQRYLVFNGRKDVKDFLYYYDVEQGIARQLPILDVEVCGWSSDGSILYLFRTNFPFSDPTGELFSIDLRTMALNEISGPIKGLLYAEYCSNAGQLLAIRNDNLYVANPADLKWKLIAKNVSAASWSKDGSHVTFIAEKGTLLNHWEAKSGQIRTLFGQPSSKR